MSLPVQGSIIDTAAIRECGSDGGSGTSPLPPSIALGFRQNVNFTANRIVRPI